ncbi:GIY-YIG nuclease family protein [Leisingera sp.]|uniref:GIY-YIG nuclease family protein n=1 Tax=Leisingera sp. TaxID=1879318 RepID=UPI003A5BAF5F
MGRGCFGTDRHHLCGAQQVRAPRKKEVRHILHKIGVTSQDVRRRVADARNDATFLLADVDIVATYELPNLSRMKIEDLLHRFFDAARLSGLTITDRFGKRRAATRRNSRKFRDWSLFRKRRS